MILYYGPEKNNEEDWEAVEDINIRILFETLFSWLI